MNFSDVHPSRKQCTTSIKLFLRLEYAYTSFSPEQNMIHLRFVCIDLRLLRSFEIELVPHRNEFTYDSRKILRSTFSFIQTYECASRTSLSPENVVERVQLISFRILITHRSTLKFPLCYAHIHALAQ